MSGGDCAPNGATARVVKVVADAERAARIAELRLLLEDRPNLRTDTIRDRIAELEADRD